MSSGLIMQIRKLVSHRWKYLNMTQWNDDGVLLCNFFDWAFDGLTTKEGTKLDGIGDLIDEEFRMFRYHESKDAYYMPSMTYSLANQFFSQDITHWLLYSVLGTRPQLSDDCISWLSRIPPPPRRSSDNKKGGCAHIKWRCPGTCVPGQRHRGKVWGVRGQVMLRKTEAPHGNLSGSEGGAAEIARYVLPQYTAIRPDMTLERGLGSWDTIAECVVKRPSKTLLAPTLY